MESFTQMAEDWIRENLPPEDRPQVAPEATRATEGMRSHAPDAWNEDFLIWVLDRCCWRDRCSGGVGALHRDFCNWAIAQDSVPCRLDTFALLLEQQGFLSADGLVYGLVLSEDLWAFQPPRTERDQQP